MNDQKTARQQDGEPDTAQATTEQASPAAGTSPGQAPPAAPTESAPDPAREVGELKDKLLRALAEMENLRRRTAREITDARQYAIAGFARDVLQIADNMHRALGVIEADLRQTTDANIKALIEGVDLTERELLKVLDKHGVKMFSPLGEKFDPHFHQAMYEVADGSAAPGTVAQVVQAGYLIGERVLRPALVAVAKAPPKSAAPSANDNGGSQSQS